MVTKKIKKDICNSLVGKNIVLWSIVMLLLWTVLLPLHETSQSPMILLTGLGVLVVLIVMSYMYGLKEYHKITKRIGMVEQFNEERFQTYKHFHYRISGLYIIKEMNLFHSFARTSDPFTLMEKIY